MALNSVTASSKSSRDDEPPFHCHRRRAERHAHGLRPAAGFARSRILQVADERDRKAAQEASSRESSGSSGVRGRHLCTHTRGIGVNRDGAFAEYITVPASNLWLIPDDIPSEFAAFFDPLGNATHCALSFDVVGEDVLITGAGPIGIMAAGICRFIGARHVVVTDVNDYRLELARKMGATHLVNVGRENLDEAMRAQNIHEGFDIGLEMSGNPGAFNDMLHHMYNGGKVALLGILPAKTLIDWDQVIFKGLHIKGIYGREMFETWYKMTQMVVGGLDLRPVLTHRIAIDDYMVGFEAMKHGQCGKVVCSWH